MILNFFKKILFYFFRLFKKPIKFLLKLIGIEVFLIRDSTEAIRMLQDTVFGMSKIDETFHNGRKIYDIYRMFEFTTLSTGEPGMVYTRNILDNYTGNEEVRCCELADYCFDFVGILIINHFTVSSHVLYYFDLYDSVNYGHIDYRCANLCTIYTYDMYKTGHGIITKRFTGKEEDGNGIKM